MFLSKKSEKNNFKQKQDSYSTYKSQKQSISISPIQTKSCFNHSNNINKTAENESNIFQFVETELSPIQNQPIQKQKIDTLQPIFNITDVQKKLTSVSSKPNTTGIPLQMKKNFESLSGFSFDDVKVHYHSDKPAQLQALAYAQGNNIYLGPGQEKHLSHELGHIVQQKQGRVKNTGFIGGLPLNDNPALEAEADYLSTQTSNKITSAIDYTSASQPAIQRMRINPYLLLSNEIFETAEVPTDMLQEILEYGNEGDYELTHIGKTILEKIISDRQQNADDPNALCPFEIQYQNQKIEEAQQLALKQIRSFDEENWEFLSSITAGNDPESLTSKKNKQGNISHTIKNIEPLIGTVKHFYDIVASKPKSTSELEVFRGIHIPRSENIEQTIQSYKEVIPCSASWELNTPLEFAFANSKEDSVILKIIVPNGFPLLSSSLPIAQKEPQIIEPNAGQREVLLGAFRVAEVQDLQIIREADEFSKNGRITFATVTIQELVPGMGVAGVRRAIEDSYNIPTPTIELDEAGLAVHFPYFSEKLKTILHNPDSVLSNLLFYSLEERKEYTIKNIVQNEYIEFNESPLHFDEALLERYFDKKNFRNLSAILHDPTFGIHIPHFTDQADRGPYIIREVIPGERIIFFDET